MDLIRPYTFKGKDKTQVDFMCIIMIDPATGWFKIVELLVSELHETDILMGTKGHKGKDTHIQHKQRHIFPTQTTLI